MPDREIIQLIVVVGAFLMSGCSAPGKRGELQDWRHYNTHRVFIMCFVASKQGDLDVDEIVRERFRRQGFVTVSGWEIFRRGTRYSPRQVNSLLRRASIDGVFEVECGSGNKAASEKRSTTRYYGNNRQDDMFGDDRKELGSALQEWFGHAR